jgi:hypothetical protein
MKNLNWKEATRGQLLEIAFNDKGANPRHKIEAADEIRRRDKAKQQNIKYVEQR